MKRNPAALRLQRLATAPPRRQAGAVLIISLIILLIMTLLGVTAMSSTTLEERMAGNMRDRNTALQAAEATLTSAEAAVAALAVKPSAQSGCAATTCVWPLNTLPDLGSQSVEWWETNALDYGASGAPEIGGVASDPRYVVEEQAFVPDSLDAPQEANKPGVNYYRITARGTGATDDAQVVLQSTFTMRFN